VSRLTQAVVLLLFGGAILRASLTDLYLRYVKEGLRPFLIAAGALLVITAVMTLWQSLRATPDEHDHDHSHHEPSVGWLLILPVLGLLLVAPPALGSFAAGKSGSVSATSDSDYPPLATGDPVAVSLLDYASRALFDEGKSLTGRTVQMTGFVTPGPGGSPMLARMVLTCCAADGRPIKIGLTGQAPAEVPANTWIQVTGAYSTQRGKDPVNDVEVAYLEVQTWQEIAQPKQPYA
jgi:uncharacterized repeat protein (TIGR03943 family)